jgi:hypothetical protein
MVIMLLLLHAKVSTFEQFWGAFTFGEKSSNFRFYSALFIPCILVRISHSEREGGAGRKENNN